MNGSQPLNHHDAITYLYAEKIVASFQEQMSAAERVAEELNNLLANYESTLEHEGMRGQRETLARWTERYRHGLVAAGKIFRNGKTWLVGSNNRLNPESEELGSLENEGMHIFHKYVDVQTEDFTAAAQQVNVLPSRIEYLFGRPATKTAHA